MNTQEKIRSEFLDYFYKESVHCEQKPTHLTADTIGILVDFLSKKLQQHEELIRADERKKFREIVEFERVSFWGTPELELQKKINNTVMDNILTKLTSPSPLEDN